MKIKVWDGPTRIFHWLLACAFFTVFFTSRGEWYLDYHALAGYTALGLVAFRVFWGFSGNRYARFSGFVKGWGEVSSFIGKMVKFEPVRYIGHNPAVGWVVLAMLAFTSVVAVTGVVTYGGEEGRGFWADYFTFEMAFYARPVHVLLAYFVLFLIVVHICAALFHDFVLKENIIVSMVTGTKEDEEGWEGQHASASAQRTDGHPAARLAAWSALTAIAAFGLVFLSPERGGVYEPPLIRDETGAVVDLEESELWREECGGSCHAAFHPSLLPARSWLMLMADLENHFGDDASLDDEDTKEILEFLMAASAEHSSSEASFKITRSIGPDETPLRVTETRYWKKKHSDIKEEVYDRSTVMNKSNCKACHPGSGVGSFEDADISIPE